MSHVPYKPNLNTTTARSPVYFPMKDACLHTKYLIDTRKACQHILFAERPSNFVRVKKLHSFTWKSCTWLCLIRVCCCRLMDPQQCLQLAQRFQEDHGQLPGQPPDPSSMLYFLHIPRTAGRTYHSCFLKLVGANISEIWRRSLNVK